MNERDPITPRGVRLDPDSFSWRFTRSSGSGGQHVNKVSTRVELRCELRRAGLPPALLARVEEHVGSSVITVACSTERSQWRNRLRALDRLGTIIDEAAREPDIRRATRPSRAQRAARLDQKKRAAGIKAERRWRPTAD